MKAINILKIVLFFTISLAANSQNLIPMLLKNGRYSYVQPKSKSIVIEKEFDEAKPFSEGVAFVKIRSKWGAINSQGEFVLKPQYSYLTQYNGGFIGGELDFSEKENVITDTLFHYAKNYIPDWDFVTYFSKKSNKSDYAIIRMRKNGNMFIVNRNIEVISKLNEEIENILYNENQIYRNEISDDLNDDLKKGRLHQKDLNIDDYSNGFFRIKRCPNLNESIYYTDYLNLKGELLLKDPYYDYNFDEPNKFQFNDGIVMVLKNGKYGYIDTNSNEIVPVKYSSLSLFKDGIAKANNDGYDSYITKKGIPIIPFDTKYSNVYEFNEGTAVVTSNENNKNILIGLNSQGEKIFTIPYEYALMEPGKFSNGKLPVSTSENDKKFYKIIDKTGKTLYKSGYEKMSNFSMDGVALVQLENLDEKKSIIDTNTGKEILTSKYDKIYFITEDYKNEIINSLEEKEIDFDTDFTDCNIFIENLIFVKNSGFKFYVDKNGFEYKE